MKKWIVLLMAAVLCLSAAACTTKEAPGIEGFWQEEVQSENSQSGYQLTFNADRTFEERTVSPDSADGVTTVSGTYTLDGSKVILKVTAFSGNGMEAENLMNLGANETGIERQFQIDGDTLYLYDQEKQAGRTEKPFEGKFVRGQMTE